MTRTTPRIRILAAATTLAMSVAGVVVLAAPATAAT